MHSSTEGTITTLYTFRSNFSDNGTVLRSDAEDFLRRAHDLSILYQYIDLDHFETEYASHVPVSCNSSIGYTATVTTNKTKDPTFTAALPKQSTTYLPLYQALQIVC